METRSVKCDELLALLNGYVDGDMAPGLCEELEKHLMLIVGTALLRNGDDHVVSEFCRPARCLAVGAAVGVLTGFPGVGGGFLILPALVLFAGVEMKKAIGTSLAIIAL